MQLTRKMVQDTAEAVAGRMLCYDDTCREALQLPGGLAAGVIRRDFGISEWDWPQGVGLLGLSKLCQAQPHASYEAFVAQWFEEQLARGLPARNINTTAPLLALVHMPALATREPYASLCRDFARYLAEEAPKTPWNGLEHVITSFENRDEVRRNPGELWIDTLFMAVLFLERAGRLFDVAAWREEAYRQALVHTQFLYDKQTGLFHHGWSFLRNDNFGGVFWLRGNGWYTLAMGDWLSDAGDMPRCLKTHLHGMLCAQAHALRKRQNGNGLWHTVLCDEASYTETSGSAAVAAGWLRAVRGGLLPHDFVPPALACVRALLSRVDADGTVRGVSAGTVVGENEAHYRNIVCAPMAYGQSLTLLALSEALWWLPV